LLQNKENCYTSYANFLMKSFSMHSPAMNWLTLFIHTFSRLLLHNFHPFFPFYPHNCRSVISSRFFPSQSCPFRSCRQHLIIIKKELLYNLHRFKMIC
jgi:hypothetical protein